MSLTVFHGLPTHVLLVHGLVVLVPLTALALVAGAVSPRAARRMGLGVPLLALLTLALVPFTTHSGEWLKGRLPPSAIIDRHARLGGDLLPWTIAMVVMSAPVWWLSRPRRGRGDGASGSPGGTRTQGSEWERTRYTERVGALAARFPRGLRVGVAALSTAAAIGAVVYVYRIGDSGAKATWQGVVSQPAAEGERSAAAQRERSAAAQRERQAAAPGTRHE